MVLAFEKLHFEVVLLFLGGEDSSLLLFVVF